LATRTLLNGTAAASPADLERSCRTDWIAVGDVDPADDSVELGLISFISFIASVAERLAAGDCGASSTNGGAPGGSR
jgi:hypothetical protein